MPVTKSEAVGHNLFAYCGNNPVNMVDESGYICAALPRIAGWGAKKAAKKVIIRYAVGAIAAPEVVLAVGITWDVCTLVQEASITYGDGMGSMGLSFAKKIPTGPSQMQEQVEKKQAPKEVDRVDRAHNPNVPNQKAHVHFKDGTAINYDGTRHDKSHGTPKINNNVIII